MKRLLNHMIDPTIVGYLRPIKHMEWITRGAWNLPVLHGEIQPDNPVTPDKVEICRRLLGAYQRADADNPGGADLGTIWPQNFQNRYAPLVAAVHADDAQGLAALLNSMLRSDILLGISTGGSFRVMRGRIGRRVLSVAYLDKLVSLGEYLGTERAETPEQGGVAYALRDGPEALLERIEVVLNFQLNFPQVGGTFGLRIGRSLVTIEAIEHVYVARRVHEWEERLGSATSVLEIGGGYGGLAYWFNKVNPGITSYQVVDLPLVNILQGYFLSLCLTDVSFYGEQKARVSVLPYFAPRCDADVVINENSMPEMSEEQVRGYATWVKEHCLNYFYSYNQEAYSPYQGSEQILVPRIMDEVEGLKRIARNESWVRRGYVEEVYTRMETSGSQM
jgi:hypothetical protein